MEALRSVTKDLAHFVFVEHFGFSWSQVPPAQISTPLLRSPLQPILLESKKPEPALSPKSVPLKGESMYAQESQVPLFSSPVAAFDGVIMKIPFGAPVIALRVQNRWQEVNFSGVTGWVLKDALGREPINPQFISGHSYQAEDAETRAIRAFIDDSFFGGSLHAPLQDVEYVTFRLATKSKHIDWDHERPRLAGTWQRRLKGRTGIHMSVEPTTDAVMEVIDENDVGHLLYVDAVFNDKSILVSEIGGEEVGQFLARKMAEEEWRELRPVFIGVS